MPAAKMTWAEAARKVLERSSRPLHSKEIVAAAVREGWVSPSARSPDHSLQSAIWKHIRKQGNPFGFVMIGAGRIHRKYWLKAKQRNK